MPRLISVGECMVELAPLPEDGTFRMAFAGDTLNTAWYLARHLPAGWSVDYLTAVGTDAVSDRMVAFVQASGIGTGWVQRRADRTVGLYMIELHNGERRFSYWRGQSAARGLASDRTILEAALRGADLAYVSGITFAILAPDDRHRLLDALQGFRAAGGRVAFDPNLRPRLWENGDTMCATIMQAAAACDIALPSFDDEAEWFGDHSPGATAQRYARAGVPTVVVKNGSGAVITLHDGTAALHPVPPAANVVDTTAAGDSFNAGFLACWLSEADMAASVSAGTALATRVIGTRGALVPGPGPG